MSDDDLEPMRDELSALLQQERQRAPVPAQVSTRIREQVAASVGLGLGLGGAATAKAAVSASAKTAASGAKAAASASAKAAVSATATSTAIGTTSVVIAPKVIAIVGAVLLAGGLSTVVATKVLTPSPASDRSRAARSGVSPSSSATVVETCAAEPTVVPTVIEPVTAIASSAAPAPTEEPKATVREGSRDHDLASERSLIEQARQAVGFRRWAAASSLLDQHRRRFNRGRLAEERDSLRVPVLVMLGRHDDARAAAERFHARYPTSIFATGVDQALRSIP
jgi:hypothetical protein